MTLTKQVQRIVAQQIRPYILPLPYSDFDDPAMIAAFLGDEDWRRWLMHWASCYVPLRTVCVVFHSLHLGELLVANLERFDDALLFLQPPDEMQVLEIRMVHEFMIRTNRCI